ncbi:hypothetical protein Ac2012v2_001547 [Leucoagaricus gongylophorus]
MRLAAYRRVEVMKMQHKAVPLDPKDKLASPPLDQRLHIRVQYCEQDKIFWVRKTLIAGRALDFLCVQFDIKNNEFPTRLFQQNSETQIRNDAVLLEQIDDGSTLIISHSS